jgi:hypothetical protein
MPPPDTSIHWVDIDGCLHEVSVIVISGPTWFAYGQIGKISIGVTGASIDQTLNTWKKNATERRFAR